MSSSDRSARLLLCVLALAAAACSDKEPGGPEPLAVSPASGSRFAETAVRITGRAFYAEIQANYDDHLRSQVVTTFTAQLSSGALGIAPLDPVNYVGPSELSAVVPRGLAAGSYDLTLTDPRGKRGFLAAAFQVLAPLDAGPDLAADLRADQAQLHDLPVPDLPPDLSPDHSSSVDVPLLDAGPQPSVTTIGGTGTGGWLDGAGSLSQFQNPSGIAVSGGVVYVGDSYNHRVRTLSPIAKSWTVATLAGIGIQGYKNGAALIAELNFPDGLAVDSSGTVYLADSSNDVIRKISGGTVSTAAGSGAKGSANGAAASASFNYPHGIALDGGNLYIADTENHRIRLLSGGTVTTFAGSSKGFADGPLLSARFSSPAGIAALGGRVYVADSGNNRIRVISGGQVTTLAGDGTGAGIGTGAWKDGPAASAQFWNPVGIAVSGSSIYVVDQSNHRVRLIQNGTVSTISGHGYGFKDGPLASALFYYPKGIAIGPSGELYVADQSNHRIRMITLE